MNILHLTAHLGGGVGKAMNGLVAQAVARGSKVRHAIITFEEQEKPQFIELIRSNGGEVTVCPTTEQLQGLVAAADILQLEWWNHPATLRALCTVSFPPIRLLVWSHVSGLFNHIFPLGLIETADQFIFTSPCSFEAKRVAKLPLEVREKLGVVSSSGGFAGFPGPASAQKGPLRAGYIGSLNFSKLHPQYVEFLAAVDLPDFTVRLIGDTTNRELLERQCAAVGRSGMLQFRGYTCDPVSELSTVNVLVYLLNPEHYGTTENALIEAMAMGIVPVVLDNPAERNIVINKVTGLVVRTPEEFVSAIHWLNDNPRERHRIGCQAAVSVREKFTAENMELGLSNYYADLIKRPKKGMDFMKIFGREPSEWFLSCQGYPELFSDSQHTLDDRYRFARYSLIEKSKGTVFHFLKYFPDSVSLSQWATTLTSFERSV